MGFRVLHSFTNTDGGRPQAELIEGKDGSFYGTTSQGGQGLGGGTVFRITKEGQYEVIHSFNDADGRAPKASLLQTSDGNFYGTTCYGAIGNQGVIFRINSDGKYAVISVFNSTGGKSSRAELVYDQGSFYGTTYIGGTFGYGTVFRIAENGSYTVLHSFDHVNGSYPVSRLIKGSDGGFYGTTTKGGTNGFGTFSGSAPRENFE